MTQLEQLQSILLGDETRLVESLRERIADKNQRTRDISEVLPVALIQSAREGNRLTSALEEPVTRCLKTSIRKDPQGIADILFPVMGPAIRSAIAEAMHSFIENFNQTVESTLTPKGLRWRWQAFRSGTSYADIALRNMFVYRVEQAFLIHKQSGLLIEHVVDANITGRDGDAVSGMLTAVEQFVKDAFNAGEDAALRELEVGDHTLWLEHGPHAMLVCVIRGVPPARLRLQLEQTIEKAHLDYQNELREFKGNSNELIGMDEYLQPLLQLEINQAHKKTTSDFPIGKILAILLLFFALGLLGRSLFNNAVEVQHLTQLTKVLNATPGYVVTDARMEHGLFQLEGLQDPIADWPEQQLAQQGIDVSRIVKDFMPFHSLEQPLIEKRLRLSLDLPETVSIRYRSGVLLLSGEASLAWLTQHSGRLLQLSGAGQVVDLTDLRATDDSLISSITRHLKIPKDVRITVTNGVLTVSGSANPGFIEQLKSYISTISWYKNADFAGLTDSVEDNQAVFKRTRDKLEKIEISFEENENFPVQSLLEVRLAARLIGQLDALSTKQGEQLLVTVHGITDSIGSAQSNRKLRSERAESVITTLIGHGIRPSLLQRGNDNPYPDVNKRAVKFKINR